MYGTKQPLSPVPKHVNNRVWVALEQVTTITLMFHCSRLVSKAKASFNEVSLEQA